MLSITSHLAALAGAALVALSVAVSLKRAKLGVEVGTGDDPSLLRLVRAHGNFVEYVPLALILIGLAEFRGASPVVLMGVAALLAVGRAAHAVGMIKGSTPLRGVGMLANHAAILTAAALAIF